MSIYTLQEVARFAIRRVKSRRIKMVRADGTHVDADYRDLVIRIRRLEWLFEKDASAKQTVCAGSPGRPCPTRAPPTKKAFAPSVVAFRQGGPWKCPACAHASITPEQEQEALRKRLSRRTPEQRREAAARAIAKRTPEQRKALASKASKAQSSEMKRRAAKSRAR